MRAPRRGSGGAEYCSGGRETELYPDRGTSEARDRLLNGCPFGTVCIDLAFPWEECASFSLPSNPLLEALWR